MMAAGTYTLNGCHDNFSKLNAVNQVKVIKLCDRIAFVFEIIAEYDEYANLDERENAAYRNDFKAKLLELAPPEPSYAAQVVETGKQVMSVLRTSPKRVRKALCGDSPCSDDEPETKRPKPS